MLFCFLLQRNAREFHEPLRERSVVCGNKAYGGLPANYRMTNGGTQQEPHQLPEGQKGEQRVACHVGACLALEICNLWLLCGYATSTNFVSIPCRTRGVPAVLFAIKKKNYFGMCVRGKACLALSFCVGFRERHVAGATSIGAAAHAGRLHRHARN